MLQQFPGGIAEAVAVHPLLEGAPHHQGQKTHEDVGLGAVGPVMVNGTKPQIVFGDAEAVFDLGQPDVGFPEGGGVLSRQVGAQEVAAVGLFGPGAIVLAWGKSHHEALFAFVAGIGCGVDVYVKEAGGAGVFLEEASHAALGLVELVLLCLFLSRSGRDAASEAPPHA